jgi:sugar O-acyltransferase (sialic acid O-acetyltransferase NeuD family)
MTRRKLVIYGIGYLADKIVEYNKRDGLFEILGFVDDKQNLEPTYRGLPAMHYDQFKKEYGPKDCVLFVAIGYVKCNYYRELVSNRVVADGYELVNYISPNAICWEGVLLGKNIFVADNAFVGHGSKIHDGVIIYEGCTFSHDTEIEPYCFVSLCAAFGGFTKLGHHSFIGLHSTVKDDVKIGAYNIVGCGTNVIHSTSDYNVTVGNPGLSKEKDTLSMKI